MNNNACGSVLSSANDAHNSFWFYYFQCFLLGFHFSLVQFSIYKLTVFPVFVVLLKKEFSSTIIAFCHSMAAIVFSGSCIEVLYLLAGPGCFEKSSGIFR